MSLDKVPDNSTLTSFPLLGPVMCVLPILPGDITQTLHILIQNVAVMYRRRNFLWSSGLSCGKHIRHNIKSIYLHIRRRDVQAILHHVTTV